MYNEQLEQLIDAALADGVLTEKEKQVLFKKAQTLGVDLDEFEMVLDARLVKLQKEQQSSAPKSNKLGDVKKCPACGAIVQSYQGVCQECGFAFENTDANSSSKRLYEAISKEKDIKKKQEIIETFPIPNTKADLLEFLTALKPRISDLDGEFANVYYKKYSECIEKVKVSFLGDKQLQSFIDDFSLIKKEIKKKKFIALLKKNWKVVPVIVVLLSIGIFLGIQEIVWATQDAIKSRKREKIYAFWDNQEKKLSKSLAAGNAYNAIITMQDAKNYFDSKEKYLRWGDFPKSYYDCALELITYYTSEGFVDSAIYVYDRLTPDHEISSYSYQHGTNNNYESSATGLIRKELIKSGEYDEAWRYTLRSNKTESSIDNADSYYNFMLEVVLYLCQENKKQVARKFVKDYNVWFAKNVDQYKDHVYYSDEYKKYNSSLSKSKLLKIINEY